MYYWKNKTINNKKLEDELLSLETVNSVKIATAYLSDKGIKILKKIASKYNLTSGKITLYLSAQFSALNPGDLLEEANGICTVYIVSDANFHPKVYLLHGSKNLLIYGSSNFTAGGFGGNIEFDYVGSPRVEELKHVNKFFDFCSEKAAKVDVDRIAYYKSIQSDLKELSGSQRKISSLLTGYEKQNDEFKPDTFDIGEYFFNYRDYETFFERNIKIRNSVIENQRKIVQEKMLDIHKRVYPSIKKLGLYCHKREDNITSTIYFNAYNHYTVAWVGVRYGKSPAEVDMWNEFSGENDDIYGFHKHGSLQFNIYREGFEVLFHLAVRNGAIDRMKLSENRYKLLKERRGTIEAELQKLTGESLEWNIFNDDDGIFESFYIDKQPIETFCDWYMENDKEGMESHLRKHYEPDDEILLDIDSISAEVIRVMTKLAPLYNAMVWRPGMQGK